MKYTNNSTLLFTALITLLVWSLSWAGTNNSDGSDSNPSHMATAVFAGGCFWCMEPPFDKLDGVLSTISGYTGGHTENPTYEQVSSNETGHYEAVEVTYDPTKIDYATLLNVFWHNVDPLTMDGQFCDKGDSYRTAIFYQNEKQKKLAKGSKKKLENSGYFEQPIVTAVLPAQTFYEAEDYHQNYYQVNPARYKFYRFACGRDKRLEELWGSFARESGPLIPTTGLRD